MNNEYSVEGRCFPSLCWRVVLAGTVAAIAIHLFLSTIGLGAGLATFTPMTDANPVSNFSMGAAIIWSACAIISLCVGGVIAGRFSSSPHVGFVHGVLVWGLTLIITLLLLSMGTGMALGGAMKVMGEGLGIGSKAIASGAGDSAKEGVNRAGDQVKSFIDEGIQSAPTNGPAGNIRAKREIGFAVTKLFTSGENITSPENHDAAVKALTQYGGMNEADATKTVDDWTTDYKNLKSELDKVKAAAEQKAREGADVAARNLSRAAIWSFFALLIGLLVASLSGAYAAKCALKHAEFQSS